MVVKLYGKLIVCETVVCELAGVNKPCLPGYTRGGPVGTRRGLKYNKQQQWYTVKPVPSVSVS